jgi:hypothetical protein
MAVFECEGSEKGRRFRLKYLAGKEGGITVDSLVGPPGGDLESFVRAEIKKIG